MDSLAEAFAAAQEALFQGAVEPVMMALGWGNFLPEGFAATMWLLVGALQLLVMLLLIAPLQRWRPVQTLRDAQAVRVDVIYTLVHRLGLFRVFMFFAIEPVLSDLFGVLRVQGWRTWQVDQVWPGVTDLPLVSFVIYLVLFDFVGYVLHRAQHRFEWWWALHALHHSQRDLSMWSDNRNHVLSDVISAVAVAVVALAVGVAPGQFVALVALAQLCENLQHANVRIGFGRLGERLWISPRFHRHHHAIGLGHESNGRNTLGGCNFGVLLPCWDMLFGTACFDDRYEATGVRDQVEPDAAGRLRDYGRGFWSQQWRGVLRLVGRA